MAKVTQNPAQYPLNHVTYAPSKLKIAMSKADNIFRTKILKDLVCFDSLQPSQQFFSHVRTGLPGLIKCLAQGHNIRTLPGKRSCISKRKLRDRLLSASLINSFSSEALTQQVDLFS